MWAERGRFKGKEVGDVSLRQRLEIVASISCPFTFVSVYRKVLFVLHLLGLKRIGRGFISFVIVVQWRSVYDFSVSPKTKNFVFQ
jgi:hypothetical protein